jgi:activator of 2-hydroxyglutaryl-CoA dehydratase
MNQLVNGMIMNGKEKQKTIESGRTFLGIEFGSTRIKAVLVGADQNKTGSSPELTVPVSRSLLT